MKEKFAIPAVGAIIVKKVKNEEFILVQTRAKNSTDGTDGLLEIPAGKIREYENIFEALRREVWEETGAKVIHTNYLFSLPNTYLYSGFLVHTIDSFFRCQLSSYDTIEANDDASECQWIPLHKIDPEEFGLNSIRKGVRMVLQELL